MNEEMIAGDGGLHDDDIVDAFVEVMDEAAPETDMPVEDGEADGEPVEAEEEAAPTPDYPMPEGWEQAMWDAMAPEVRGAVDKLVKGHAEALSAREKAMQEVEAAHREQTMKANAEMQTSLGIMRRVVEGEFAGIDWAGLAKQDPAMYVELQAQYQQRMNAIQQMQKNVAAQSASIAQAQAAQAQEAMKAERAAVLPKIQALMGSGYNGAKFSAELKAYLEQSGVPSNVVGMMSKGYEVELATKAMLYDRLQSARDAAAAKVASAPAVQVPRGAAPSDGGNSLKKALARLNQNPNDSGTQLEAFMAVI